MLLLTLLAGVPAHAAETSCGFTVDGRIIAASAEICPEDVTMSHLYRMFPTIIHDAVNFYDLKNGAEFIAEMEDGETQLKSSFAIERYIKYSAIIIFNIIKLIWLIQLVMIVAATIKDQKLGGNSYGASGVVLRLAVGFMLFVPYGESGTLGTLLLAGGAFMSLAMSNILMSTIGYFYQNWNPVISESVTSPSGESVVTAPRFVAEYSQSLTKALVCTQNTELAYVRDKFVEGNKSVAAILDNANYDYALISNAKEMKNTSIVKNSDKHLATIGFLQFESPEFGGSQTCAQFSFTPEKQEESISKFLKSGGRDWETYKANHIKDSVDSGISDRDAEQLANNQLDTFFEYKMMDSLFTSFDRASIKAKELAEVSRAMYCVDDPLLYAQSRDAINAINNSNDPTKGFDLRCAKIAGGKLDLLYTTNSMYMNPESEGYVEEDDKLRVELYNKYQELRSKQDALFKDLAKLNADSVLDLKKESLGATDHKALASSDALHKLRRYGLFGFSFFITKIGSELEDVHSDRLSVAAFSPKVNMTVDENYMLPYSYTYADENKETISEFFSVRMPSLDTKNGVIDLSVDKNSVDNLSNKDLAISDAFSVVVSSISSYSSVTDANGFDSSAFFDIDVQNMTDAIVSAVTNATFYLKAFVNADFGSVADGYIRDGESEFAAKQRFVTECLSGRDAGFASHGEMVLRCESLQRHPMYASQELGKHLLAYSATIFGVQLLLEFTGKGINKVANKKKANAGISSNKTDTDFEFLKTATNLVTSSAVVNNIAVILFIFGVFFAFLLPLAPNVIFVTMYLGWFVYAVITLILSPLLFMSFVILKGRDESSAFSEKNLVNVAINFTLKPVLIILSFMISWGMMTVVYRLTIILFGTYIDTMSATTVGGFVYDVFIQMFTYLALIFAFYKIMYWSFTKPPQVLNMIMERLGGENVISKENMINGVIGAMGYGAMMSQVQQTAQVTSKQIHNGIKAVGDFTSSKLTPSLKSSVLQELDLSDKDINVRSEQGLSKLYSVKNKLEEKVNELNQEHLKNEAKASELNEMLNSYTDKNSKIQSMIERIEDSISSVESPTQSKVEQLNRTREALAKNQAIQSEILSRIESINAKGLSLSENITEIRSKIDGVNDSLRLAAEPHVNDIVRIMFELENDHKFALSNLGNQDILEITEILRSQYQGAIMNGEIFDFNQIPNVDRFNFEVNKDGLITKVSLR